jgi:hypothetical protein
MATRWAKKTAEYLRLREEKSAIDKESKEIGAKMENMRGEFLDYFDREEMGSVTYNGNTVYESDMVVPVVKDWDTFMDYVVDTGQYWLLEKRPASTACRELFETKGKIPGLEPFTRRNLNVRKA